MDTPPAVSAYLSSKNRGEFYTPQHVVDQMIELVEVKKSDKVLDPACGTGGILRSVKDVCASCHGMEINEEAAKLDPSLNIKVCDTLLVAPEPKYDVVIANPPFGVSHDVEDWCPVKSKKGENQFVQYIALSLAEGGRAAIVIPDGILFGKNHKKLRKWLVENYKLVSIISLDKDTFKPYAGVKTSILFFKTGKTTTFDLWGRETTLEEMVALDYSLHLALYEMKDVPEIEGVEWKTLGELFDIEKGKVGATKFDGGEYPFVTSRGVAETHSSASFEGEAVIIPLVSVGDHQQPHYVNFPDGFEVATIMAVAVPKDGVNSKYVWLYLYENREEVLESLLTGSANKSVTISTLKSIRIPLPSMEEQACVVEVYDRRASLKKALEEAARLAEEALPLIRYQKVEWKTLDEVCDVEFGERVVKSTEPEGDIPVYGGGEPSFNINRSNRTGGHVVVARFGVSEKNVRWVERDFWLLDSAMSLRSKTSINRKYLMCALKQIQHKILECAGGAGQANISIDMFKRLRIPAPSVQEQGRVVAEYEAMQARRQAHLSQIKEIEQEMKELVQYQRVEWKTLGEMFNIEKGDRTAREQEPGEYQFFKCSPEPITCSEYDRDGEFLLVGSGGEATCHYVSGKFAVSTDVFLMKPKEGINAAYVNIYLRGNMDRWASLYNGATITHLSLASLKSIRIPLPSKEEQARIVEAYDKRVSLKKALEEAAKLSEEILPLIRHQGAEWKSVEELFDISVGKKRTSDATAIGYPMFVSSSEPLVCKAFDEECDAILVNRNGDYYVHDVSGKFSATDHVFILKPKRQIDVKFVKVWLKSQAGKVARLYQGATIPGLSSTNLKGVRVPLPSKEEQERVVAEYEIMQARRQTYLSQVKELEQEIKELVQYG